MNPNDVDELRELLHPLVLDVESVPYPPITADTLARRKEARTR
ncbi:hypothetical protein ACFORH_42765 [Amycolatopsis roodepoortensis]|uniref:Uncharacterized protein n=1 Tax=Amycolatopsis roodepoortensis TaxID=700274 RepID=A0ABR9L2S2_9PSEU|nr:MULTISPECIES: hypothetical protein [Amycolatopsis]MBE1575033.1 hypothetical protein [Amycolatopsis roodepoortensis]GHG97389.1 hypothetical protein GCM10017788_76860 [Amycolatopsis acidiphila]